IVWNIAGGLCRICDSSKSLELAVDRFYRKHTVGLVEIFDYADNVGDCTFSMGKPAPGSTPATGMAQVADNLDCFSCNIAGSLCYIANWRISLGLDWTGFKGNTLWDWMSLLFLPVALMVATVWFNTRKNQQANASHGVQDITPSQKRALLTLIPTELLPAKPSLPSFTTGPPPTTLASQPKGRRPFSFSISRRAVLAYLAIAILIVGSVASEYWNVFVNKDHPVASSTSAHTIDGYDAAIANGVMLGYNVQHTRVDPYEKDITPVTVLHLEKKW